VTTDEMTCSAKDCKATAVWGLRWNNPKIHTPERRKVWLACEEHKPTLTSFLDRRGFFKDAAKVEDLLDTDG